MWKSRRAAMQAANRRSSPGAPPGQGDAGAASCPRPRANASAAASGSSSVITSAGSSLWCLISRLRASERQADDPTEEREIQRGQRVVQTASRQER